MYACTTCKPQTPVFFNTTHRYSLVPPRTLR